jgi:hypothetical protein
LSGHVVERLSAYLDQELEAGERQAVEAHLGTCDECSKHLEDIACVDEMARALPLEAPPGYFEALPGRVRFKVMPRRRQGPRLPVWAWAAAAAHHVAVVTPALLERNPKPAEVARSVAPPPPPKVLPAGEPDRIEQPAQTRPPEDRDLKAQAERRKAPSYEEQAIPKQVAPPPAPAPAAPAAPAGRAEGSLARSEESPAAKAEDTTGKDEAREATTPQRGTRAAPAEGTSFAAPPESALLEGAAGQHLYQPEAETDTADAPSAVAKESKRTGAAANAATAPLRDVGATASQSPRLRFRDLLAVTAATAEEARRLREQWRAFVAQGPAVGPADEGRVRVVETGLLAWRFSNDPVDLSLARRDAEAYLRRDDAAQGERVRSLLASTGN